MGVYSIVEAKDNLSRLIDEALEGQLVTITRHGKAVVNMMPAMSAPRRMTAEDWAELRNRREAGPEALVDSVTAVREMRDDER